MAPTAHEAALGALLGACVGDAAGVTLEFTSSDLIKPAAVDHALTLPGGGVFGVGPGQVSDDTELAQCLALGLTRGQPPTFPAEAVARCYADWYSTGPFDIGQATSNAASAAACAVAEGRPAAEAMWQAAAQHNGGSKANGALMRAVPLALWGCRLEPEQLAAACSQDTCLSHPNQSCQDATAAYCIAIAWLINHSDDAGGAVTAAEGWASQIANEEVQGWLREAAEPGDGPSCLHMIGFVRWGFVHAFRHLRLRTPFEAALADMLRRGGDVDTNACIVCGVMGALHGAGSIPPPWPLQSSVADGARTAQAWGSQDLSFCYPSKCQSSSSSYASANSACKLEQPLVNQVQ